MPGRSRFGRTRLFVYNEASPHLHRCVIMSGSNGFGRVAQMSYQSLPQLLSQIDLFSGVPDSVIADLVAVGVRFEEPPGQH